MAARGWGRGGRGRTAKGYRVSFRADENALNLDCSDGCTSLKIY